jgi:1-aminocyclopropane-1-carboxylate deaminase/D-cysteine desulfhydrase-like pyridoxal-dependent ACC family enzyme
LLLGFSIAGLRIEVVGARVGPRFFVNRIAVLELARRTGQLIRRLGGQFSDRVDPSLLRVEHSVYAGGYGRPFPEATAAADVLHEASGIRLDDTYSAKAWLVAMNEQQVAKGHVLFLLTFDARCLTN